MIRQQELIMRLHDTWESRELGNSMVTVMNLKFEDIDAWAKRYPYRTGLSEPVAIEPEAFAIVRVARFFEEVGVLLQKKLIDIEIVDEFSFYIKTMWEKMKPVVEARRKDYNPTYFKYSEYLYNEVKKREQQLASKTA